MSKDFFHSTANHLYQQVHRYFLLILIQNIPLHADLSRRQYQLELIPYRPEKQRERSRYCTDKLGYFKLMLRTSIVTLKLVFQEFQSVFIVFESSVQVKFAYINSNLFCATLPRSAAQHLKQFRICSQNTNVTLRTNSKQTQKTVAEISRIQNIHGEYGCKCG